MVLSLESKTDLDRQEPFFYQKLMDQKQGIVVMKEEVTGPFFYFLSSYFILQILQYALV